MFERSISVIIPNYNYGRFLPEAISSVVNQTVKPLEIILVDDGSTDNSVEIAESFGNDVKIIKQKNGGVGKARNIGAENSSGELLAFLDADDIWNERKLEMQLPLFDNPQIGYVTCGMREFNSDGETVSEYIPRAEGWKLKDMVMFRGSPVVSGSAFIVRKSIFTAVGGFDENPEMHPSEDWDFARRVLERSKIAAVPKMLVEYRNHGDNGHLKIPRFERSMMLAYEKTFLNVDNEMMKMKRRAYGTLHKILAGSYFQIGASDKFIEHSSKSLLADPRNAAYFAGFPLRRLRQKFNKQK